MEGDSEEVLDVRGLLCPLPVLKARKVLERMQPGQTLRIIATDPMAAIDMPHFCVEQGHSLLRQEDGNGILSFRIKRK